MRKDARTRRRKENPLFKHDETTHEEEKQEYAYEAQRCFWDPLTRPVHEGVRINRSLRDTTCRIMNSKPEFRQEVVPKIEIG